MTDKLFDNFIQQQLYHKESPVPPGLWDKIAAQQEKEKPALIWWKNPKVYGLGFAVVSIFLAGIFLKKQQNTSVAIANKPVDNTQQNQVINSNSTIKNIVSSSPSSSLSKTNNDSKISLSSDEKHLANSISNRNIVQKRLQENKSNVSVNSTQLQLGKKNNNTSFSYFNQNITSPILTKQLDYGTLLTDNEKVHLSTPKKTSNGLLIGVSSNLSNQLGSTGSNANETQFFTKSGKNLFAATATPPIINLRKVFGLDDCPSANGSFRNDFYIEGYASADYTMKRVDNISTTDAYLAKKDSAEKMRGGFTLGVRFSKSISDNMFLKAGFQFTQMFEQFKLTTENERRVTTTIVTRTLVRAGLPDTTISDTTSLIQIGYRTQRNTNLYRSIELPILLSYEFGKQDSKYSFALTAGAIINLSTWNNGITVNELNQIVSINSKPTQNSFYTHQIGLSAYLSASVIKQLNEKWSFFAEPYLRYSLGKNNVASGFVQQFDAIGINFGTRLKLNK
ncbi:MAG: hypothetical protein ACOVMI_07820 [Chitinophagaceae bacterium]